MERESPNKQSSKHFTGHFAYATVSVIISAILVGARIYKSLNDPWDTRPTRFSIFYRQVSDALVLPLMLVFVAGLLLLLISKDARRNWLFWVGFVSTLIAGYSIFTFITV